jgi:pimeloyl-ACP methyl ester carboxylesterase
MHDEADALERMLEERGIGDAILVGHSDGASIALIHCGKYGRRVRALVALAPHLFVEEHSLRGIRKARTLYEETDLREKLARYHTDPDATFYGWNRIWLDPAFAAWNIREYTQRIVAPVFAVQGAADEYGTFAQIAALAEDVRAPLDVLHLHSCGHNPLRDRPDSLGAIARYLSRSCS